MAAIDCGTNSIRLLISRRARGRTSDVVRLMRIVRLGEGVDTTGRLSSAALERTGAALSDYAAIISEHGVESVRMVATSASRDADNAEEFRELVTGILGVAPQVISGDEEARLSFEGAVADLPAANEPRLVVDIGGGSTEFVRGIGDAEAARSVNIGCVRMTERHLRDDPPTAAQIAAATADITEAVDAALDAVDPDRSAASFIGLAGSVTTVAALAMGLESYDPQRIHHAEISYQDVAKVTEELLGATRAQRLDRGPMHPGRADVIGGGALVLRIAMERAGAETVVASEHDILDGIAASLY
ncbi:Ppx/GppA phosphatase family protein [Stackebrandtia sp.]|uniref:Ppx/GppA phosphatase family protein n=1 Tax=Stackebrandtia sp. TaxID=2023065 RepID=UPI0032C232FD